MGWLHVIIGIAAAICFYPTDHTVKFWISVASAAVCFWSWGVMHNHAMESAKLRRKEEKVFLLLSKEQEELEKLDKAPISISKSDALAAPNWLANIALVAVLTGVVMLIWGLIVRLS